jgi:hypothetical protein
MKLLELSQRAEKLGFTIGADSDGLKLKPITSDARAMLKTKSINGISSMHELIIIVTMLELGV